MMRKVCIVTAARSEYGLLRWTIDGVDRAPELELQLVVTGAHLSHEHGETWRDIEEDGYHITAKVDMGLASDTKESIVESMGRCSTGFAKVLAELDPDMLVVLGDRYELLPICSAALVMNIPIAHISGGDVTIGAIDNQVRNSVTMMSTLHFPGVQESARNIERMTGDSRNIIVAGEPGLENFMKFNLWSRERISESLGIPADSRWVLVTVHPETQQSLEYNMDLIANTLDVLASSSDISVVITKANADFGGNQINDYSQKFVNDNPDRFRLYPSLGQIRYLSFMKECYAVVGNSSSGIVEAPCLGKPVINIGRRQTGRHLCSNVFQVDNNVDSIRSAWTSIMNNNQFDPDFFYGDGKTSETIVKSIKSFLFK